MALASTSRVVLTYVKETDFGETPIAGNHNALRYTGESLNFNLQKEVSNEINAYRGSGSAIPVSAEATGDINAELAFKEYDPFIAAALQNNWDVYGTNGVSDEISLTFDDVANTATAATPTTGDDLFTKLKKGQWVSFEGVSHAGLVNKVFRIDPNTAPTSTVLKFDAGTPVPSTTAANAKVRAARLTNGTIQPSFSIQKEASDVGEFFVYNGMTVSSMNVNIASQSISTLDFSFMGAGADADDSSFLPGSPVGSVDSDVMSAVASTTCMLWYDGVPLAGTYVNSISLSYDNALRMQNALCKLGAVGIGAGTIDCTLDLEVYFASGRAFYDEFLANVDKELVFSAFDTHGNGYVFTLPKANISSYSVTAGSKDNDLMASISVTGLMYLGTGDHLEGKVLLIDRVGEPLA